VGVDAGYAEHQDGCEDEDGVEAGQPDENAVDGVLHLGPEHKDTQAVYKVRTLLYTLPVSFKKRS
jgi:hypothetical protein